ncbi:trypsin-like serine protease [Epidermidibacterium keratini]|uniref:Trypsin-like serine protease n=2 Tax=Epidermidibacterium keratini TaxID=1891644 RepID=A0A7L4YTK5_9ACTN|nr:trypsin-like serine protease [Epidermidibacterium keratini]
MKLRIAALATACGLLGGGVGATAVSLSSMGSPAAVSTSTTSAAGNDATSGTVQAVAAKALPSVVEIGVQTQRASGLGSGVVLSADGNILTNYHVIEAADTGNGQIQVRLSDGTTYDATIVGTNPSADLAVIKASGASGLTPATFADSSKVQVGEEVVAIGAPQGLQNTVTSGIVSYVGRQVSAQQEGSGQDVAYDAIQTDASINPGNSGGPLLNSNGEVIGINSVIYAPSSSNGQAGSVGLGFAIPSNTAADIANQIVGK